MTDLATPVLLVIFVAAAGAVWVAGVQLSDHTDVLATRLHLGAALGGLILLAVATNLPEIAITVAAAASGNLDIAVGNILGGIALQTVVLVVLDVFGVRGGKPLTYRASSLVLVLEATLVVAILGLVVAATQLPGSLLLWRLDPTAVLIVATWFAGLLLLRRASAGLPWHEAGEAPDNQDVPRGHSRMKNEQKVAARGTSTAKAGLIFGVAAAVTLVAGIVLEQSGEAIAGHVGLSGILFGATFLAAATALPEVSTGLTAVRNGDFQLAMSDIFGGNAFLPTLFLLATVVSGKAILPHAHPTDIYLTAGGIVLTLVYAAGLLFRPTRRIGRMGIDSLVVLAVYVLIVAGLVAITHSG